MSEGEDLTREIEAIVADRLRADPAELDASTALDEPPLSADSLDLVELAEAIEAKLGIYVPDEALAELETVGDLVTIVRERR